MSYAIESIAKSIGARRVGKHKATIDWLLTDSRSLSFPEETLFFALTTKRNSGARYIPDLYDRGVRNFVITEEDFKEVENGELRVESSLNFLIVPNPLIHSKIQKFKKYRNSFIIFTLCLHAGCNYLVSIKNQANILPMFNRVSLM